jgi:hypothetical protein
VLRPSAEQLDWFQAQKERPRKVPLYDADADKPWEGMTDQEIHEWVSDPAVSDYARLLRHIRYCGRYSTPAMVRGGRCPGRRSSGEAGSLARTRTTC